MIAVLLFALPLTAQQEQEPPNLLQGRAQWFRARRTDASGKIPPFARIAAQKQVQQMRAQERQRFGKTPLASLDPTQQASLTQWMQIGPMPIQDQGSKYSGRVTTLAVDPTNENIVYAGGAEGGIWKTTDGGTTWRPLTDTQGSLSSGSIAIDPNNPSTVYVGTGEEDFIGFEYPGNGILKSTDGGTTWSVDSNKFAGGFVGGLAVSPGNSQLLMAAVESAAAPGIWRSTDGGSSWSKVTSCLGNGTGLVFDPTNGNTVYAGCDRGQVFKSKDGGVTWNQINAGVLPSSWPGGPISIAVAKSSPSTLYVQYGSRTNTSVTSKSTDGGTTWTSLTTFCTAQCLYNNVIAVDPANANVVLAGDVFFHRSLDGGKTWDSPLGNPGPELHVDNHAFAFSAAGDKLYVGDDGGVLSSTNFTDSSASTVTWNDLNAGLAISQFYPGMAIDPNNVNDAVGGTQDNGSDHYTGSLLWQKIFCCDGGYAAMDFTNPSTFYVTCQGKCIEKTTNGGSTFAPVENGITGTDGFAFINPLVLDPSNHNILYFAAGQLYQTTNGASSWTQITSPTFLAGTNAVAPAPNNNQMVYLASGASIWVTSNALSGAGATWTRRSFGLGGAVTSIAVDPTNANVVYVTLGGFTGGGKHVFKTTNAGVSWRDISGNLPDAPAENLVIDPAFPGTLYLGNDVGVFGTSNGGTTWNTVVTGLPNVVVMNLELHQLSRTLRAATYGRSTWDLQLPKPTPPCTANTTNPSVTICAPKSGATVSSPVSIVAETNDSHAIQIMQLYIDGSKKYQSATPTLKTSLAMSAGTHTLTVQAVDTIGQIFKRSESITVKSSSCTVNTANPSVTICTPTNGATVSSPVHIVAKTTDSHTVTLMQVYVDGVRKYQIAASSIDTNLAMTAGTHRLTVQAIDSIKQIFKQTINITVH